MPSRKSQAGLIIIAVLVLFMVFPACKAVTPPPPPPEAPEAAPPSPPPPAAPLLVQPDPRLNRLDAIVSQEMTSGGFPGAVILVGHQGKIVYHKAFGFRSLVPRQQPMLKDTIFDLASLTKVVATTTAIMQLVDAGRLNLDTPAGKYWPEFNKNGKRVITVRQLMLHSSGLRADVNPRVGWQGYLGAVGAVAQDHPVRPPGSSFQYSDANFIALGEIVHRVSGLPLDVYCQEKIFKPLGMRHTSFRPPAGWQDKIAPADFHGDRLRWGEVHDPTAHRMGGVAGNAGVFSTAQDLAFFVQMILNKGELQGKRLLSPKAVAAMTKAHHIPGTGILRGLGWDMESPFAKGHMTAFPKGSFGHTGYTGTSIWVDPRSQTFIIILTSRLHPDGRGDVKGLRARVAKAVAIAYSLGPPARMAEDLFEDGLMGWGAADPPGRVQPGIEVLAASGFAALKGKNIGLITNHSGIDRGRRSTILLLRQAPGVKVRAIFSPEHGLDGTLDEKVPSGADPKSGLPVYSLYGKTLKPTRDMLRGLDALVYDIQDVGVRYYTYITTMAYAMEAAAAAGLEFFVLDRPNPISAAVVQGPVLDRDLKSFIGYYPLPLRYGMTAGELAHLFNREAGIGVRLQVVRLNGYRREAWFDETGLPWVNPSPNLRTLAQTALYSGVGMLESANVSVGRGTPTPFEVIGAPWIDGPRLAKYLQKRQIAGVEIEPVVFVPQSSRFRGQRCQGVRFRLVDRRHFDGPALGVEVAAALYRLFPGKLWLDQTLSMIGSREVLQAIKNGEDPKIIWQKWQSGLTAFLLKRQKYLLY
ncbi:MAG: exo-beta-N-acetylmuramidase NamZ domain-containing protein [Desulfobaccales bacterium]